MSFARSEGRRRVACVIVFAFLLTIFLGCGPEPQSQEDESLEGHPLTGEILEVDLVESVWKVAHDDIPGFMPAMTMEFRVSKDEITKANKGDKISARLVRDDDGGFRLVHVMSPEEASRMLVTQRAKALEKRLDSLGSGRYLGATDEAPDFALIDQSGAIFDSTRLAGGYFVMNFIFTRCPDANMCPLSTSKMRQLQVSATEQGIENLSFVSITLDPEFDTPEVLENYQKAYGIDPANFYFLTGPKEAVRQLIRGLGVTAIESQDTVLHSLSTSLVSPDGEIVLQNQTSGWDPEEFLAAIKK